MRSFWGPLLLMLLCCADAQAGIIRGRLVMPPRTAARESLLAEAVVYVDPLPDSVLKHWDGSPGTIRIVQQKRRFTPRVTAVVAGATVRFQNRDDVYHNVFSVSPAKRFDIGKYPPHALNQVTFDRPGVINLFCDIHPGMMAYVLVLPHRFFTRPDRAGDFSLPRLPPGRYTLRAWHPSFGRITRRVDIPERGDVAVQLRF